MSLQSKNRNRAWDKTPEAADYRREYNKTHYDNLRVACPLGTLERIDAAAKPLGMSRAAFVIEAIDEKLEKLAQGTIGTESRTE